MCFVIVFSLWIIPMQSPQNIVIYTQFRTPYKLPLAWFYDCVGVYILPFPLSPKMRQNLRWQYFRNISYCTIITIGLYMISVKHPVTYWLFCIFFFLVSLPPRLVIASIIIINLCICSTYKTSSSKYDQYVAIIVYFYEKKSRSKLNIS